MIKSMIVTKTDEAHSMSQTLGEIWLLKHPAALSEPYRGLSFLNFSVIRWAISYERRASLATLSLVQTVKENYKKTPYNFPLNSTEIFRMFLNL